MITKYFAALAATALVAAPVAAAPARSTAGLSLSANPAANLSISRSVRAGSATTKKNGLVGGGLLIGLFAVVAVVGIVVVATDGGDSDSN
jgi:hypothetical protein